MDGELAASLLVLALIDSTSFGTLLVPLWLMLTPGRLRPRRVVLFLATVAAFYLVLGIGLTAGARTLLDRSEEAMTSEPVRIVQYVVGVVLVVAGVAMEPWTKAGKAQRAVRRAEREARDGPGRMTRWRARATDGSAPATAVITLAVTAAAIEAASMLPYLAAIGLLTTSDLSLGARSAVLVGYCLVMIAPALVLLTLRTLLHERIASTLARLEHCMQRHAREGTAWVVFLLGLYLLATAETGVLSH